MPSPRSPPPLRQFVNFKLYHSLGLRYPPVLDPRLEEAAEGLAAVMKDLAGQGGGGAPATSARGEGPRTPALPAAPAVAAVDGAEEEEGEGLAVRMKQLEGEIRGERPRKGGAAAAGPVEQGGESEGDEDADEEFEIDSGGSEEEEEGGEEVESEEEESEEEAEEEESEQQQAAADPTDSVAAESDEEEAGEGAEDEGEEAVLVGGAVDVEPDDDAGVCAALFRGLTFFLAREVPREQLLLVVRAFGGEAGWDGEGSPIVEGDERITHQVRLLQSCCPRKWPPL